ncbi:MAG TPA: isoprenylcysteine carboxylmethyltransferase family protein [Deltaproteobacteria bacterium]|nr:isoprenylcysteine carboxylmethyltransferase family protein [Deltaproteobacteria bacterium]
MTKPMTMFGVGPRWGLISLVYGAGVFMLARMFPVLYFPAGLHPGLNILGALLILVGLPYYFLAVRAMTRAFKAKELATSGVYAVCRHPLYGSWIVFLAPGIVLLTHIWLGLSVPMVMYLVLRVMVKEEEDYLATTFGKPYLQYKAAVPFVSPTGWLKKQ